MDEREEGLGEEEVGAGAVGAESRCQDFVHVNHSAGT